MSWENEADAHRNIPILTEDEELIWRGMGSMTVYLEEERRGEHDESRFSPTRRARPLSRNREK